LNERESERHVGSRLAGLENGQKRPFLVAFQTPGKKQKKSPEFAGEMSFRVSRSPSKGAGTKTVYFDHPAFCKKL